MYHQKIKRKHSGNFREKKGFQIEDRSEKTIRENKLKQNNKQMDQLNLQ